MARTAAQKDPRLMPARGQRERSVHLKDATGESRGNPCPFEINHLGNEVTNLSQAIDRVDKHLSRSALSVLIFQKRRPFRRHPNRDLPEYSDGT